MVAGAGVSSLGPYGLIAWPCQAWCRVLRVTFCWRSSDTRGRAPPADAIDVLMRTHLELGGSWRAGCMRDLHSCPLSHQEVLHARVGTHANTHGGTQEGAHGGTRTHAA